MSNHVTVARIYDEAGDHDARRVLVDRVWPRGVSKSRVRVDEWCKQVAPSTALRKWYGHDPQRFSEFKRRYRSEINDDTERRQAFTHLRTLAASGSLTLLTATKRSDISQAAVLVDLLQEPHDL